MTNWPFPPSPWCHNHVTQSQRKAFFRRVHRHELKLPEPWAHSCNVHGKCCMPGVVRCYSTVYHIKQRSERIREKIEAGLCFLHSESSHCVCMCACVGHLVHDTLKRGLQYVKQISVSIKAARQTPDQSKSSHVQTLKACCEVKLTDLKMYNRVCCYRKVILDRGTGHGREMHRASRKSMLLYCFCSYISCLQICLNEHN